MQKRGRGFYWLLGALWFTQLGVAPDGAAQGRASPSPSPSPAGGGGGGSMIVPVLPPNPHGLDAVPGQRGGGGGAGDRSDGQDDDRQRQDLEDDAEFDRGPQRGATIEGSPSPMPSASPRP